MRKIMVFVLAACMAATAAGCSVGTKSNSSEKEIGTLAQQSEQDASTEANKVGTLAQQSTKGTTSETNAAASIKPGNYIQNSKFKMSFIQAKQYDEISSGEYFTNTPKNGKKYLVLFFEAENISEKKQYVNSFYFKAYAFSSPPGISRRGSAPGGGHVPDPRPGGVLHRGHPHLSQNRSGPGRGGFPAAAMDGEPPGGALEGSDGPL